MKVDCGLLNKSGDGRINLDPRHSWAYMFLLEETLAKCPPEKRQDLLDSHVWFYRKFDRGGQMSLPLYGDDLIN